MFRLSALIASLLAGSACFQAADATVFGIDRDVIGIMVAGSITTDGTPGTLAASNIDGWNLNVTSDSLGLGPITLTTGNSTLSLVGTALSETATQLTFDFSTAGSFQFENSTAAWCLIGTSSGVCGSGTGGPLTGTQFEGAILVSPGLTIGSEAATTGTQVIGTAEAVPEPGSMMLLGGGLLGLGLVQLRRRANLPAPYRGGRGPGDLGSTA